MVIHKKKKIKLQLIYTCDENYRFIIFFNYRNLIFLLIFSILFYC